MNAMNAITTTTRNAIPTKYDGIQFRSRTEARWAAMSATTALIPLRARDGSVRAWALVDAERHEELSAFRWALHSRGYASRKVHANSSSTTELLHRRLMGLHPGDGRQVDHRNGDKLDNRTSNLREATSCENAQNHHRPPSDNTSGVRGVSWYAASGKWVAQICVNGRTIHGGYHITLEAATAARHDLEREYHPFSPLSGSELVRWQGRRAS
jgi:HNH endonuclease